MAQGPDGVGFKRGHRATPSLYAAKPETEPTQTETGWEGNAGAVDVLVTKEEQTEGKTEEEGERSDGGDE